MTYPLDDEDEWTEAYDANIPRIDLVHGPANGLNGFLLLKSTERPYQQGERRMAKAKPQTAVYDSKGNLLGLVDPEDLIAVAAEQGDAPPPAAAPAPAPPPASAAADPALAKAGSRFTRLVKSMPAEDREEWERAVLAQLGVLRPAVGGANLDAVVELSKSIAADLIQRRVPASSAASDLEAACIALIRRYGGQERPPLRRF